ncbi:hypothetical protein BS17DRAFT_694418 [Gyrodon lividus]|nr:hypothetical protein BS17DRAFT_694418 [Gyrodon lividus]
MHPSQITIGHSGHSIATSTGFHTSTISRLHAKEHSDLQKSTGGHPSKLSPANISKTALSWTGPRLCERAGLLMNVCYAIHLISTCKAENAVQITKTLTNTIDKIQ